VYSKSTEDGSRVTMPLYVDDGRCYWDDTSQARQASEADRGKFKEAFKIKFGEVDPLEDWFWVRTGCVRLLGRVAYVARRISTNLSRGTPTGM